MRTMAWLALLLPLAASPALAQVEQIESCATYARLITALENGTGKPNSLVNVGETARCVAIYAAGVDRLGFAALVRRFEASRSDKQTGSTSGTAGSTSIVSQGAVAKVLSFAAEHGALTQSTNEQLVTVRGNLAGIPTALARKDVFPYCARTERISGFCTQGSLLSILRRVSFSVSFDPSRDETTVTATPAGEAAGPAQPVVFTADRREIASASVRFDLVNRRDVTAPDFVTAWKAQVGQSLNTVADDLLEAAGDFAVAVMDAPSYDAWHAKAAKQVAAAGRDRTAIVAALHASLAELLPIIEAAVPDYRARARQALAGYSRFFLAQDELIDSLAAKQVLAFEYVNDRPAGQLTTSQLRFIADVPVTRATKVVANAAVTWYNSRPVGLEATVERLRDTRFGIQLDHALGSLAILGPASASAALYYQRQNAAAVLEIDPTNPVPGVTFSGLPEGASHAFTKTGDIWLGQAKLTVAPPNASVKIPFAITYSNRTELIDKPAWSAQIGVAYDFDSLFGTLGTATR